MVKLRWNKSTKNISQKITDSVKNATLLKFLQTIKFSILKWLCQTLIHLEINPPFGNLIPIEPQITG